jgi:excisionase family DNA binding protein
LSGRRAEPLSRIEVIKLALDLDGLNREQLVVLLADVLARLIAPANAPAVPATQGAADANLLTAKEMAARLSVPESKVRSDARTGRIPCVMVGRYMRFRPSEVERAFSCGRLTSVADIRYTNGIGRR